MNNPGSGSEASQANLEWPNDLSEKSLKSLGQVMYALLKRPENWVHRRVERIYFRDHTTVRHQVSVDFSLPRNLQSVGTARGNQIYAAPLFLFRKDPPRQLYDRHKAIPMAVFSNIDLVDGKGQRLSLLARSQANLVGARVLIEAANKAAPGKINDDFAKSIGEVATGDSLRSERALAAFIACKDTVHQQLLENDTFRELMYTLAQNSLVICLFMGLVEPHSIIKIAYDDETYTGYSSGILSSRRYYRRARSKFSQWDQRVRRSLGWKSELYVVGLNDTGASASYHLEIDSPKELEITEVGLVGARSDVTWERLFLTQRKHRTWHIRQVQRVAQGNIFIPEPPGRRRGYAWVKLRVRKADFLTVALIASLVISTVLGMTALFASKIIEAESSDAAVALLLLLPTLLAAYVARPREHEITMRILRVARLALAASGALSFLAAFSLLAISCRQELEKIWTILALSSLVFVVIFIISNILPQPHGRSSYKVE
jgi:uncharacterized membrane protein YhaH (DUF805 family)